MIWFIGAVSSIAAAYQLLALFACVRHILSRARGVEAVEAPGVSILKPVHGPHPGFEEALATHARQDYPRFELLIGYSDPGDPSIAETERAMDRYPTASIRHFICPTRMPNRKIGVLVDLIRRARYPIIIVNDADIAVPAGYIRSVTAPLSNPAIGLITCLYRAEGDSWISRFEALGVTTDFAASALCAPLVGVSEFGFGSTLAFRRYDLDAAGGFGAVGDYLADDYQLGARIHKLGRGNLISPTVVSTRLAAGTWRAMWRHQVRWARTVRLSRGDGYIGLPVTFASLWAILALALGFWWIGGALMAIRLAMALTSGWFVLRSPDAVKYLWLVPLRDVFGAAVWAAGLFGNTVEWGGRTLRLDRAGRILDV